MRSCRSPGSRPLNRPVDFADQRRGVPAIDEDTLRGRFVRMNEAARASQLAVRQLVHDYVDGLWAGIKRAGTRRGKAVPGDCNDAGADRVLWTTAFEVVYHAPE